MIVVDSFINFGVLLEPVFTTCNEQGPRGCDILHPPY